MALRGYESYPPQEPFSSLGAAYDRRVRRLGAGIDGACFAYGDDPYQELAVFPAAEPGGTVLAFMHGGGWTNGYKEWMAFMAPALTGAGVTFVSIGYRLAPATTWPDGVRDVAAGLRWVHDNIAAHGGDPARLFVGGHYAAWLAVRDDWQASAGLPANVIRGALPVSGVYDFTETGGLPVRPRFLGEAVANDRDASPVYTIARTPPFLIAWGDRDFPHLIPQAERMAGALGTAGGEVKTLTLDGCDHLGASYACGMPGGIWPETATRWMASR